MSLPLVALLRATLYACQQHQPVSLALLVGFGAAFLVLLLYVAWGDVRVPSKDTAYRFRTARRQALAVLLVGLSLFQGSLLLASDPPTSSPTRRSPSTPSCIPCCE